MVNKKVFLDSSVIVSALLSSKGSSFYILNSLHDDFDLQISEYVLEEVLGILAVKFSEKHGMRTDFFLFLSAANIRILSHPKKPLVKKLLPYISENDVTILANAFESSNYLLTLDNEFFGSKITELANLEELTILKPGEFLKKFRNAEV